MFVFSLFLNPNLTPLYSPYEEVGRAVPLALVYERKGPVRVEGGEDLEEGEGPARVEEVGDGRRVQSSRAAGQGGWVCLAACRQGSARRKGQGGEGPARVEEGEELGSLVAP